MNPGEYNEYLLNKRRNNAKVLPILCLIFAAILLIKGVAISYILCFFMGPLGAFAIPAALLISIFPLFIRRSKPAVICFLITVALSATAYILHILIVQWITKQSFGNAFDTLNQVWFIFWM